MVSEKLNALQFAKLTGDIPQNINFAIKTGAVRDFLDNSAVPYVTAEIAGGAEEFGSCRTRARLYHADRMHGSHGRRRQEVILARRAFGLDEIGEVKLRPSRHLLCRFQMPVALHRRAHQEAIAFA